MTPNFEPITARYLNLELLGKPHRLYVEEAGSGVPLVCLHTAGSDSRQYRAVLNDPEVLAHHRVIAFDLPWHGKSSPPAGWQDTEYRLSADDYETIVMQVIAALGLEQPLVMGCSIGGRLVLQLAARHADRIGGVVGLQSGLFVDPYYDIEWLHRADVHGGEVCMGVASGLIGPHAPDDHRWETLWHYAQGGPGVFKGDLHYYTADGDLRELVDDIDPSRCPVVLLTGEYDYSCSPKDTAHVAERIGDPSALRTMEGLGHFPMSEDPERFLAHLRPALADLRAR